jgi:hypothetical protein
LAHRETEEPSHAPFTRARNLTSPQRRTGDSPSAGICKSLNMFHDGTTACRQGPMVRIHLPPAASPLRTSLPRCETAPNRDPLLNHHKASGPPAGISVAAMLIDGPATLPWTFLGSFSLNLWTAYSGGHGSDWPWWTVAVVIASASMLQTAIGGTTLRHAFGYPAPLDNGRDLSRFLLLAPVFCLTSATLSLSPRLTAPTWRRKNRGCRE